MSPSLWNSPAYWEPASGDIGLALWSFNTQTESKTGRLQNPGDIDSMLSLSRLSEFSVTGILTK